MKKQVKYIFVVLTYRNSDDLKCFINSVQKNVMDYQIIVINSYYDDDSLNKIQNLAIMNGCEYQNIENKGYSYGNNQGIKMALEKYEFQYLIVSNADIEIVKFNTSNLGGVGIYCGTIMNLKRQMQNPMLVIENRISDCLIYHAYTKENKMALFIGIGLNKVIRSIFLVFYKNSSRPKKIFQAHGSFIIFTKDALKKLDKVFDEKVFLFGEEGILAKRAKKNNIPIYYTNAVCCKHKEDGSMSLFSGDINKEYEKANIYYYENYCKKGKTINQGKKV